MEENFPTKMNSTSFLQTVWREKSVIFLFCSKWAALGTDLVLAITSELSHQPGIVSPRIFAQCFLTSPLLPNTGKFSTNTRKRIFPGPSPWALFWSLRNFFKPQSIKGRFWHTWILLSCVAEDKWKSRQVRRAFISHFIEQTLQVWDHFQRLK